MQVEYEMWINKLKKTPAVAKAKAFKASKQSSFIILYFTQPLIPDPQPLILHPKSHYKNEIRHAITTTGKLWLTKKDCYHGIASCDGGGSS